jgi:hypothetical protein
VILTSSVEGRGSICPYCRRRTLWPLARPRRPYWYYRCAHCAARVKRQPDGPWLDASGPVDEAVYRRPSKPVQLPEPAPAPDDPSPTASLLWGKWRRQLAARLKWRFFRPPSLGVAGSEEGPNPGDAVPVELPAPRFDESATATSLLRNKRLRGLRGAGGRGRDERT